MSRKANPTIIGLFVLIGFALGVGAVLMVSSSRFFTHTREYIIYFDASLTGLDPGAPVKFRGVTVGSVKEVLVHFNQPSTDSSLPVIIAINSELMKKRSDPTFDLLDVEQMHEHVRRGLRAKLESQSLLTGLLYVDLEFVPAVAAQYHQVKKKYEEIPSAPVNVQIFRVDFAEVTQRLNKILATLDTSLDQVSVRDLNCGLTNLLNSLNRVASSPEITNTLISVRQSLDEVRELSASLKSKAEKLSLSGDRTLQDAQQTLSEVKLAATDLREMLAPEAKLRREAAAALKDLSEAARTVSSLAEFLERHPNALISGRKTQETNR